MTADELRRAIEEENRLEEAGPRTVEMGELRDILGPPGVRELIGGWLFELRSVAHVADEAELNSRQRRVLYCTFRRWASEIVGDDAPAGRRVDGGYDVLIQEASRRLRS